MHIHFSIVKLNVLMSLVHLINQPSYQQFVIFPSGILMFFSSFEMYLKDF